MFGNWTNQANIGNLHSLIRFKKFIIHVLFYISSLRFHNGLTHFLAFRDNQEKLNYRAIRQEILIIIVLLTCIGTKIKRCTKIKGQGHSQ